MIKLLEQCPPAWQPSLNDLLIGNVGKDLEAFLSAELASGREIYPSIDSVFKCLQTLEIPDVKAVILGQDPYYQPGQASGRAFEVGEGVALPPSLVNILKLLERDLGTKAKSGGLLAHWEREGVLLLNTVLTVNKGQPASHRNRGWELITDRIIEVIVASQTHTAFLLWGAQAQKKAQLVAGDTNLVLMAPHPSPLSAHRGFFDCQHFSLTNKWLALHGQLTIEWLAHSSSCRSLKLEPL